MSPPSARPPRLAPADETSVRDRFSLIGHASMPLMNALTERELVSLLDAASLERGESVLDLGAGRGDLARLAAQRYGVRVVVVDRSPAACAEARTRTTGLDVEVVQGDVRSFLTREEARESALACAVGALHAFGSRLESWTAASEALSAVGRQVLLADLVAHSARAADELELASLGELGPLRAGARAEVLLAPDRVIAYERAWCDAIGAHAAAHPNDPRSAWARGRVEWSRDARRTRLFSELSFLAILR